MIPLYSGTCVYRADRPKMIVIKMTLYPPSLLLLVFYSGFLAVFYFGSIIQSYYGRDIRHWTEFF